MDKVNEKNNSRTRVLQGLKSLEDGVTQAVFRREEEVVQPIKILFTISFSDSYSSK
jgi:hypothetical protein